MQSELDTPAESNREASESESENPFPFQVPAGLKHAALPLLMWFCGTWPGRIYAFAVLAMVGLVLLHEAATTLWRWLQAKVPEESQ